MFFGRRKNSVRRPSRLESPHTSRNIRSYDDRFATNNHGLQIFNGPNLLKVSKTAALLTSGIIASFGASAILFNDGLSKLFGGLVLSFITVSILAQHAKALGEQRRTGSNLVTQAAISWGRFTNELTRYEAENMSSSNAYFNLFNGGAKIFDNSVPPLFKSGFEWVIEQLIVKDDEQLRLR